MPPYTSTSIWPQPSGVVDCTDGFTESAGETVSAPTMRKPALLVDARKTGVHQSLRHDLGRVKGGRRIKEEMLIVHRVCVDLVQFKLCHTPMVERRARGGLRLSHE